MVLTHNQNGDQRFQSGNDKNDEKPSEEDTDNNNSESVSKQQLEQKNLVRSMSKTDYITLFRRVSFEK